MDTCGWVSWDMEEKKGRGSADLSEAPGAPHKRHHISRSSKKGLWVYLLIFNCFDQVTSKRQLQEGERGFILDHSWRRHQPSRRGGAWLQHREAAGHTVSVVRK